MSISDASAAEFRSTPTYRAALWCARLGYAWGFAWLAIVFVVRPSDLVIFLTWLLGLPPSVGVLVLMRRSGIRFVRHGGGWRVQGREIVRQFGRDVFWLRRP